MSSIVEDNSTDATLFLEQISRPEQEKKRTPLDNMRIKLAHKPEVMAPSRYSLLLCTQPTFRNQRSGTGFGNGEWHYAHRSSKIGLEKRAGNRHKPRSYKTCQEKCRSQPAFQPHSIRIATCFPRLMRGSMPLCAILPPCQCVSVHRTTKPSSTTLVLMGELFLTN